MFFNLFFFFGLKGQECEYIYVTSSGTSSQLSGTKSNPASLEYALSIVAATDSIIRMAEGTYWLDSALSIKSNITIEGGLDSVSWTKSNTTASILFRKSSNILTNPNRLIAINATGKTGFNLIDLTIKTQEVDCQLFAGQFFLPTFDHLEPFLSLESKLHHPTSQQIL